MRGRGILVGGTLAGALLIVAACSSDDADSPAVAADGGLDANASSDDARSDRGSPSDSGIVEYDVIDLPLEGDCDKLTGDEALVTFTEIADDPALVSNQVHSNGVGGLVEENQASPFIHGDLPSGPNTDFSLRFRGKLTAGLAFPLVKSDTWFYNAHVDVGQGSAEYYEITADHSRAWVSVGGGTVTVVCLKDANPTTNDATYILKIEGAKMGLPEQPDGSAPLTYKGSFTANGVFRHVAKKK